MTAMKRKLVHTEIMPVDDRRSRSRFLGPARRETGKSPWDKPLWEPSQARIAGANVTAFARAAIREWGLEFNTYPEFYRWTVDRAGAVLAVAVAIRRGEGRHARQARAGARRANARRAMVSRCAPQFRREPAAAARPGGRDGLLGRGQGRAAPVARPALCQRLAPGAGAARRRRAGRRSRCRLPAEPAGGDDGDAGQRQHRRHLVVLLPRFWRAGRARPFRPDRTQGPVRGRWLLVQRQGDRLAGKGGRDRAPAAHARARGGGVLPRR